MAAYADASSLDCASSHLSEAVATSDDQLPVHDGSIATAIVALDLADFVSTASQQSLCCSSLGCGDIGERCEEEWQPHAWDIDEGLATSCRQWDVDKETSY